MSEQTSLENLDFSKMTEEEVAKMTDEEIEQVLIAKSTLSDEEYRRIGEAEFRARFRERLHHTLEIQTYSAIYHGRQLKAAQTDIINRLIGIWKERGLSEDLPDFKTALRIIEFARKAQNNEPVDLTPYAPTPISQEAFEAFDRIIKERRSVRHWKEGDVSDAIIDKVLESGLWAAHSCNLQSIRYMVIREKNHPGLFKGGDIPPGPVHLLLLQDERVYRANPNNPERNRLLDVGAAAQNIVLTAHSLGLGGVWLTYTPPVLERLYQFLDLPGHLKLVTYVDVGWPDQTPAPLLRLGLDETVIRRI